MKLVINKCYGGFGLSYKAMMEYAKRKGFQLYAFTNARDADGRLDFNRQVPYTGKGDAFVVHYSRNQLKPDGSIPNEGYLSNYDLKRDDPDLVATVEALGKDANGDHSKLTVVEIPDGTEWELDEYDGIESVSEKHRKWD